MGDQKEMRILYLHCATFLITNKQDIFIFSYSLGVFSEIVVICDVLGRTLFAGDLECGCGQQ